MTWASDSDIIGVTNNTTKIFSSGLAGENMATNQTVTVGLNLDTSGMDAGVNKSQKIHKNLAAAAQALSSTQTPSAVLAARQGVAAQSGSYAKGMPSGTNLSRGIAGATGAEGRDFAKQAQGLGGLVHVYATFAANLFAVSAAFGALKAAADTTNMVKGLDQLGAASGMALGSLSKRLVTATDGAISLREAMEATAKASSSGMSSTQILRMGDAAKKASQALGVDMSDAVSRLSRGITKLEPELLDELGIFVRIDDVVKNYATSVGKSALALTDFERRQAFANAVLDQAEKKFSAIEIDANPYAKLLASMKDIAQTGLELVNNVLGPVVKLLSSSPAGLALAMGGIASILLKQAIPALGAFRKNAKDAADAALELANKRNREAAAAGVEGAKRGLTAESKARIEGLKSQVLAEKALRDKFADEAEDRAEAAANKAIASLKTKIGPKSQELLETLRKPTVDIDPKDEARIQREITRATNAGNQDRAASYQVVADTIAASKKEQQAFRDFEADSAKKVLDLEKQEAAELAKKQRIKADYWSVEAAAQRTADAANKAALSRSIVANAGEITRVEGVRAAYTKLNADIAKSKLPQVLDTGITVPGFNILNAGFTRVKGLIGIATTAAEIFSSVISRVFMVVGAVTLVIGILDSVFSTNSKQMNKFAEGLTASDEAADGLQRTLENLGSKDPLAVFTAESIQARSTAIQELSQSMSGLTKSFIKVRESSSTFDKFTDALWDSIGRGSADKLSTNLSKSISQGLQGIAAGPLRDKAAKGLQEILGKNIDVSNIDQVESALRSLNDVDVGTAGLKISKLFEDISTSANNVASNLTSAKTKIEELSKLVQTQSQKLIPTDDISKLGTSMMEAGFGLTKALESPVESMILLNKLVKDTRALSLLSPDTANQLINASTEIKSVNDKYSSLQASIISAEAELQKLKDQDSSELTEKEKSILSKPLTLDVAASIRDIEKTAGYQKQVLRDSLASLQAASNATEVKMKSLAAEYTTKIAADFVNIGLKNLSTGLNTAMAEGGIIAARGYLSAIKQTGMPTAEAENRLRDQELSIQREALEATYQSMLSEQKNTNSLDEVALAAKELANKMDLDSKNVRRMDMALEKIPALEKERRNLDLRKEITTTPVSRLKELLQSKSSAGTSESRRDNAIPPEVLQSMSGFIAKFQGYGAAQARLGGQASANAAAGIASLENEKAKIAKDILDTETKTNNNKIENLKIVQATSVEFNKAVQLEQNALELSNLKNASLKEEKDITANINILNNLKGLKTAKDIKDRENTLAALNKAEKDRAAKLDTDTRAMVLEQVIKLQNSSNTLDDNKLAGIRAQQAALDTLESSKLNAQEQELDYLKNIEAITSVQTSQTATNISLQKEAINYAKDRLAVEDERDKKIRGLRQQEERIGKGTNIEIQGKIAVEQANATNLLLAREITYRSTIGTIINKNALDTIRGEQEIANKLKERASIERNEITSIGQARLSQKQSEIDYLTTIGAITAEESTRQSANIAIDQQALDYTRDAANLEADRLSKVSTLNKLLEEQEWTHAGISEITKADLKATEDSFARQKALLDINNAARKETLLLTSEHKAQMEEIESITKSLTSVFGELGSAIGETGKALFKMAQDEGRFAKDKLALQKKLDSAATPSDADEVLKDQIDLEKKQAKSQLTNIAAVAGASKKMFAEKSTGYKVLSAVEKIANLQSLGLMAQSLAATIANTAAKIGVQIPGVFVSFMRDLGPLGIGLAGAALASVLGGSVSTPTVSTAGLTAEDRQSTQGTGMSWVDGKKVENGGGVFGDAEAKSESIKNSLLLIKENSIEGITFDNETVRLLTSIDQNIRSAAKGLYQIPGLRTGSAFGTTEKATSSPGFLGLFASSSSTSIIDSGIKLEGTFADLAAKGKGVVSIFETVSRTKTSSGFLGIGASNKTTISTNLKTLPEEQADQISDVFASLTKMFEDQGKQLGIGTKTIESALSSIPVSVMASLRGLKGADLEKELSSIFSSIADTTATKLFPQLTKFREFGEGMAETVTRVLTQHDRVKQAYSSIGLVFKEVSESLGVATQEMTDRVTAARTALASAEAAVKGFIPTTTTRSVGGGEGDFNITEISQIDPKLQQDLATATKELADAQTALTNVTGNNTTTNISATDRLAKAMGGLTPLLEAIDSFGKNFLSDAERFGPKLDALRKQIYGENDLGGIIRSSEAATTLFRTVSDGGDSIIDTREEFKKLVQGALKDTSEEGVKFSASLLGIQDEFNDVRSYIDVIVQAGAEIDLAKLKESGQAYAALKIERAKELELLHPLLRDKKQELYDIQDANTTRGYTLGLLNAEGKTQDALNITRARALIGLSDQDKLIVEATHRAEDANKIRDLEISLLNAQGNATAALALTRAKELVGTTGLTKTLIEQRHAAEDANKVRDLELSLLNAQGSVLAVLALNRQKELVGATGLIKYLIEQRHLAEDANKTAEISIRLLNAQHRGTEALNATRAKEAKSLSTLDLAITQQIWAIEDAESAADKALAVLGKSVNAQKTSIQESIDVLEPMAKFLEEILGTLEDSIKELYGTVDSTVKMTIAASNALIESYVATGNLPTTEKEVKKLTDAIGIAVTATDNNNFASLQEANFAKLTLAAKLSKLQDSSKDQGTTADKQLVAAKAQLKTLDDTYDKAKEQVDALKGLSIDVMSVEDAIKNLENTLKAGNIAIVASNDRAAAAKAAAANPPAPTSLPITDIPTTAAQITGSTIVSALQTAQIDAAEKVKRTIRDVYTLSEASNNYSPFLGTLLQFGLDSKETKTMFNLSDAATQSLVTYAATQGYPSFASGGDHEGGYRLVGENGPEIEATGPSRIFNANQSRGMLQPDNSELIAEIRLLRREVQELKDVNAASSEYNKTTSKQLTRWDVDGMPPLRT